MKTAQELFEQLDGAQLVKVSQGLAIAWHGGNIFNIYTMDGVEVDCFTSYGKDLNHQTGAEALEAIERHFDMIENGED